MINEEKIKKARTYEHVVAFIDILGATEMIRSNQDKYLKVVYEIYSKALEDYEKRSKGKQTDFRIKIFSDNILISSRVRREDYYKKNYNQSSRSVILYSLELFNQFVNKGILVRGGITLGKLFHDRVLVWGEALEVAYKLEKDVAKYPRIIIDQKIIDAINFENCFHHTLSSFIKKGEDGIYFVDYLTYFFFSGDNQEGEYINMLSSRIELFSKILEEEKNKQRKNLSVIQKHEWHLNYLNKTLKKFKSDLEAINEYHDERY